MLSPRAAVAARTALAVAAALLLSRLWFVGHRALDLDEFEHAHAAWSVSRGLLPYRDFFEHHPPLLYLSSAPLFADPAITTSAVASIRALILARTAMWLLTVVSVTIVYRLGAALNGSLAGAFAVVLLTTSSQFLESMLEFRPDVPAVLGLLVSLWCLIGGDDDQPRRAVVRFAAGGVAFGLALLCTQKALFAAPGVGVALLLRRRAAPLAGFIAGALLPIAITIGWFASHQALRPLGYFAVVFNGRLNADGFPPFPRLVSNVIQQPAIYLLGMMALARRRYPSVRTAVIPMVPAAKSTVITLAAWSLIAGIFIIGRAYDQYYALLLPLLAVLGGALAADLYRRRPHPDPIAVAITLALALLGLGISARAFKPIGPQLDDIAFVTGRTRPSESYLGGSPGPALFRPHAWFYFFLTGDFASAAEYADLLRALDSGHLRPTLVVRDRAFEQYAPPALLAYVDAHYRLVRGTLYLRQSE